MTIETTKKGTNYELRENLGFVKVIRLKRSNDVWVCYTWNLIKDSGTYVIHITSNYRDEYVKLKNGNVRRFKNEDSAIDWFAKNEDKFIK